MMADDPQVNSKRVHSGQPLLLRDRLVRRGFAKRNPWFCSMGPGIEGLEGGGSWCCFLVYNLVLVLLKAPRECRESPFGEDKG